MYKNTDSYYVVKDFLRNSVPRAIFSKSRREENVLAVMSCTHVLYFLNSVAMAFFEMCDGTRTFEDIVKSLYEQYDVDNETLTTDIIDIIRDLQYKRILRIDPLEQTIWTKQKRD